MNTSQHLRTGIIRDKYGTILQTGAVSTLVPLNGKLNRKQKWSDAIEEQIKDARKKSLIRDKKLLQFINGEHKRAITEIIGIINSITDDSVLKIWDPYMGNYYLDFLTYMQSTRSVQVISELRFPKEDNDRRKKFARFAHAAENFILDYGDRAPKWIIGRVIKAQQLRVVPKSALAKTALKSYLDELRGMKIPIEFRYKEGTKGFSFHDRFIIGGGRCWSLGSSLNHIGDRHCLIIDVPYPEIIEQEFDRLWKALEGNEL
jgi:uncharacterized protein YeeX (DUF496 family)